MSYKADWPGVWESSFGRVRLVAEGRRITGYYECAGPSSIEGGAQGRRLEFRYQEPKACGEGLFE
ncbi:MAG: hypothetical protein ACRD3R_15075, partial [Terriglobales bacterium]